MKMSVLLQLNDWPYYTLKHTHTFSFSLILENAQGIIYFRRYYNNNNNKNRTKEIIIRFYSFILLSLSLFVLFLNIQKISHFFLWIPSSSSFLLLLLLFHSRLKTETRKCDFKIVEIALEFNSIPFVFLLFLNI